MNGTMFPDHQAKPQEQVPLKSPRDAAESPSLDVLKMDKVLDNLIWAPFLHNRLSDLVFSGFFNQDYSMIPNCGKCIAYLPVQFLSSVSKVNPLLHLHLKLPIVFLHLPFMHIPGNTLHSLISRNKTKESNTE